MSFAALACLESGRPARGYAGTEAPGSASNHIPQMRRDIVERNPLAVDSAATR